MIQAFLDEIAEQISVALAAAGGSKNDLGWEDWLAQMFPGAVSAGFSPHHREFWDFVWSLMPLKPAKTFIGIWARGGGKSTSGELAVIALACREVRKYCIVVSATQPQADGRVANIAAGFEDESVNENYPLIGKPALSKFGDQKAWRRNRLMTASGFTVDALGLETAVRGFKIENQRPDLILIDDVDDRHDSKAATAKKIEIITQTILPAGSKDCVVIGLQNLIINHGIFAQLADGTADFLSDCIISGPIKAIDNFRSERVEPGAPYPKPHPEITVPEFNTSARTRFLIVEGVATWPGQSIQTCQALIDKLGPRAFDREQQQNVKKVEGALWTEDKIIYAERPTRFRRIVIGVDPSGGAAEIGIVAVGLGFDGIAYVLADRSQPGRLGSENWGLKAVALYDELQADCIAVERNFGGEMVSSNVFLASDRRRDIAIKEVHASRGKEVRAEPIVTAYESGLVKHCGRFLALEEEQTTWVPGSKQSPNRVDALVWACTEVLVVPVTRRVIRKY